MPDPRAALLDALKAAAENADTTDIEIVHGNADAALLAYINDPEVTAAYEAVPKWYA